MMDWPLYMERLEYFFFSTNGISDAGKKQAVQLSVMGVATYYSGVTEQAGGENVCRTGGSSFAAVQDRGTGESVATYVAELRSLSEFCNFGNTLEEMIRDRLVCGINNRAIQKRLLVEPKLTYVKAVEIAQTTETAAQSMQKLQVKSESDMTPSQPTPAVNKTSATPSGSGPTSYCCGNKGHTVADPANAELANARTRP